MKRFEELSTCLHALINMEDLLDQEIDSLEAKFDWDTKRCVYLQSLGCDTFHLDRLECRMSKSQDLIQVYRRLLKIVFIEKMILIRCLKSQRNKVLMYDLETNKHHCHCYSSQPIRVPTSDIAQYRQATPSPSDIPSFTPINHHHIAENHLPSPALLLSLPPSTLLPPSSSSDVPSIKPVRHHLIKYATKHGCKLNTSSRREQIRKRSFHKVKPSQMKTFFSNFFFFNDKNKILKKYSC